MLLTLSVSSLVLVPILIEVSLFAGVDFWLQMCTVLKGRKKGGRVLTFREEGSRVSLLYGMSCNSG